jgi:hypothetical protein
MGTPRTEATDLRYGRVGGFCRPVARGFPFRPIFRVESRSEPAAHWTCMTTAMAAMSLLSGLGGNTTNYSTTRERNVNVKFGPGADKWTTNTRGTLSNEYLLPMTALEANIPCDVCYMTGHVIFGLWPTRRPAPPSLITAPPTGKCFMTLTISSTTNGRRVVRICQ